MPQIKEHLRLYPDCGVILENFNDLTKFKQFSKDLEVTASKALATEEPEVVEEPLPSPVVVDEPPVEYVCRWGSIVKKYNTHTAHTTNHYLNWPFPHNLEDPQRNATQVKRKTFTIVKVD